jgi:hypothetical protein
MKRFASQMLIALVCLAVTPCHAAKPLVRDGSSIERAIVLKQRGAAAVEEEIAWMRKLYHYTPIDSMRDMVADAIRRLKAGKKKVDLPQSWSHAILDHKGQCCSAWTFKTPRGSREIYFDTGVSINISGEVPRQINSRIDYILKHLPKTP